MMSIKRIGLAVAAASLLAPCSVQAKNVDGWYLGLSGMASFQTDAKSKIDGVKDTVKYDTGWGVAPNAGYAWDNGLRAEGEIAYRQSQVNKVTGTGSSATDNGGHISNTSFMANGIYDLDTGTMFTPYAGVGIGFSVVDASKIHTVNTDTVKGTEVAFAFQGIAGIATNFDDNWAMTADYRYFRTPDVKFKSELNGKALTENASHNVMVGVRYSFGEPEAAPAPVKAVRTPVAPAAPVAAPVVKQVPQSFMVFFDFDRAVLTPEAKRILAAAAQDFQKGKYVRIVVTGHTDTMGTAKYNQKLSERRALATQAELNRLGVPASVIQASGAGKKSLLVPTADGVREAQNRRAEIVFNK
ncbi:MAG: OmpA family protein [Alphaproteobacteria bacterium]|nr:OmpA family protein [Alphaproteobacteria bacterium]